ncbi:MAG: penicillin-binding protein activator [Gammaproteobacteria bacterium]|jgi:outer membrane PBP1 activator LpoA protein|nr:penicillin-binding protein activator [Gammaproteobacteria bacterium]
MTNYMLSITCMRLRCGLLGTLLLLLQACQSSPVVQAPVTAISAAEQAQLQQAKNHYQAGDYDAAANAYAQLAGADVEHSSRWQLRQADSLYLADQYRASASLLALLERSELNQAELALADLLQAENAIALIDYQPLQQAAAALASRDHDLATVFQARWRAVQEVANQNIGSDGQLALVLLQHDASDALLREAAFSKLAAATFAQLDALHVSATQRQQQWLDAARQGRQRSIAQHFKLQQPVTTVSALTDEQQAFVDLYVQALHYPQLIAVILPESGNLQSAADAIRKGLLSAWAMLPASQRPQLHFIDATQGMTGAYYQALDLGSDLILGPLDEQAVTTLRDLPDRTVPMLALNLAAVNPLSDAAVDPDLQQQARADSDQVVAEPEELQPLLAKSYFFALPPEDSARSAARIMLDRGLRNVVALGSDDAMGQRLLQSFSSTLEQAGGKLVKQAVYDPAAVEYTSLLSSILGLAHSQRRHQRLQEQLGTELGFRARADANIDAVFVAADQRQARLLVPQLKFIDADYLPVYTTGRSYSANKSSNYDRDLENVHIILPAWLLAAQPEPALAQVRQWFPETSNEILARLYGLGRDSLLLSAYLDMLQGDTSLRLLAASGDLYIDAQGVVQRELQHAQYRNGVARLLAQ